MVLGTDGAGVSGNPPSALGDVSTWTDRLGSAQSTYPYGTDIGSYPASADAVDFATYTKEGSTGLEYAMNRYYSGALGRFMTVDPSNSSQEPSNPVSWNAFAYLHADPANYTDPTGLDLYSPYPSCGFDWDYDASYDCTDNNPWLTGRIQYGGWLFFAQKLAGALGSGSGKGDSTAPPPDCGQVFPIASQAEAQELAVLFGEDSWGYAVSRGYGYQAVFLEDLYMLQVMYNQASNRLGGPPTPQYVASKISASTYNGYPAGRVKLQAAPFGPVDTLQWEHVVSTEETYLGFWTGSQDISGVNAWAAAGSPKALAHPGGIQFAGTVFWYQGGIVSKPPHSQNPIRLPNPVKLPIERPL
jgi:RHS repeat-associated protein